VDWVRRYGFYEGGDSNCYRIDPSKIVATISGVLSVQLLQKHVAQLESSLKTAYNHRKAVVEAMLDNCKRINTPGFVSKPIPTEADWKSQGQNRYSGMGPAGPSPQKEDGSCLLM
jgi:hypothetical protein